MGRGKWIKKILPRQNEAQLSGYPCRVVGGEVAEDLLNRGLCLPSGTARTEEDLDRVIDVIIKCQRH